MLAQAAQGARRAARQRARQARAYLRCSGCAAALIAAPLHAKVVATPAGFTITHARTVQSSPAASWTALIDWGSWWSGAHSWSGSAANIALDATAGGCLCERWTGGEVAHAQVLAALPGQRLLLDAPFGPLHALPVTARLGFTLTPAGNGTTITITMRVAGEAAAGLGQPVDTVLRDAADQLARRIDAGR